MRQVICAAIFAIAIVGHSEARTIENTELGFTLVVPDRLQPVKPQGAMVAAFATPERSQGLPDAMLTITRMGGVIGRNHLDPSKTPIPGVTSPRIRQQKWKTFDIDVLEGQVVQGNLRMAIRGAQIPLKREAIILNIAVPVGKEAQADALLSELLAGLDGQSNWLTDDERAYRLGRAVGQLAIFGALLVGGIVFGVRSWRRRSRPASA